MPIDPNNFTQLNVGEQGSIMDETAIDYGDVSPILNPYPLTSGSPVYRRRSRIVLAGQGLYEICNVSNANLTGSEYGVAVRPIVRTYANPINEFGDAVGASPNTLTLNSDNISSHCVSCEIKYCLYSSIKLVQ